MKDKKSSTVHGQPFERAVTLYLHEAFELMDAGKYEALYADPYFDREPAITQEDADRLIAALDEEYDKEIDNYAQYHKRRSGANAKPEWKRLPPAARLGLAQRLARICDSYE